MAQDPTRHMLRREARALMLPVGPCHKLVTDKHDTYSPRERGIAGSTRTRWAHVPQAGRAASVQALGTLLRPPCCFFFATICILRLALLGLDLLPAGIGHLWHERDPGFSSLIKMDSAIEGAAFIF